MHRPNLSKSKLLAFRQCHRRLWLEIHRPELREDSAGTKARFAVGNTVGDVARRLYDSKQIGVLLNAQTEGFDTVFERSKQLLGTPTPIFEAGFRSDNTVAFADVMLPTKQTGSLTWRMVEVKSSTSVKDYHREDAAIQAYIAKSAGVPLDSISIACVDSSWEYPGDEQYRGLLKETDVSDEAFGRSTEVRQWISDAHTIAERKREPAISTGSHCSTPFECGFTSYCRSKEPQPEHSLDLLPGAKSKALRAHIEEHGVTELKDVPDALLNARQQRVKAHTLSAKVFFDAKAAAAELAASKLPAYFLDFESIQFAVPIWKGTRPYQQIPFQFSLHRLSRSNALEHTSFLDLSGGKPSKPFAEALVQACGERGPIFVYNASFEKGRVAELANQFAKLRKPLLAINERMVDLLPVAQRHYYHPSQMGSWSLKAVMPAVAPGLSYEALEGVQDGALAMEAYLEAIHPETPPNRKTTLEQQLLKYCELDTLALVELWQLFSGAKSLAKAANK